MSPLKAIASGDMRVVRRELERWYAWLMSTLGERLEGLNREARFEAAAILAFARTDEVLADLEAAEHLHLEGLNERRTRERLESYADFLGDTGRADEEQAILQEAAEAPIESKKERERLGVGTHGASGARALPHGRSSQR